MLKIVIPEKYVAEKRYVIEVVFEEILGLPYTIIVRPTANYEIVLPNSSKISLRDDFFSRYPDDLSYLSAGAIPKIIGRITNQFNPEKDLPIIYGNGNLEIRAKEVCCGVDIFGSIFFMLTRWEETVCNNLDSHARFLAKESLAYREGFLSRPIVNEYIEFLVNMLKYLGLKIESRKQEFGLVPSHDVDLFDFPIGFSNFAGDILKRRSLSKVYQRVKSKLTGENPFDTFDFLMETSEKAGVASHFYFMSGGTTPFDHTQYHLNRPEIQELFDEIKRRNHVMGFHPSYATFLDREAWGLERESLERATQQPITEGRQHFFRFKVPETWELWNEQEMEIDSSMIYPDRAGFRCGTGNTFSAFSVKRRKRLNLRERPTIIMDGIISDYEYIGLENWVKLFNSYKEKCKKYKMPFTFLVHNHMLHEVIFLKDRYCSLL